MFIPWISNNLTESLELDEYEENEIVAIVLSIIRTLIVTINSAKVKACFLKYFIFFYYKIIYYVIISYKNWYKKNNR